MQAVRKTRKVRGLDKSEPSSLHKGARSPSMSYARLFLDLQLQTQQNVLPARVQTLILSSL